MNDLRALEALQTYLMFCGPGGAQSSTMGPILDQISKNATETRKCRDCDPLSPGILGEDSEKAQRMLESLVKKHKATTEEEIEEIRSTLVVGSWCPTCSGHGYITKNKNSLSRHGTVNPTSGNCKDCGGKSAYLASQCSTCLGSRRNPVTVMPMGYEVADQKSLDDRGLIAAAFTSRVLYRVSQKNVRAARALELVHGPESGRWQNGPYGDVFPLFPLVNAGKKLLLSAPHPEHWMVPADMIAKLSINPTDEQEALLAEANSQSIDLLILAESMWEKEFRGCLSERNS